MRKSKRKEKVKRRYRWRSAVSGRFVKRLFAERYPLHCVRERVS